MRHKRSQSNQVILRKETPNVTASNSSNFDTLQQDLKKFQKKDKEKEKEKLFFNKKKEKGQTKSTVYSNVNVK